MTYATKDKHGNRILHIQGQPDDVCELCGKEDELRPYGLNGENICYDCGMKDEEMMELRFRQTMLGIDLDS